MKVAYWLPIPRPSRPELDAAVRSAMYLAERFPGPIEFLYPGRRFHRFIPRWLCGSTRMSRIREVDREVDAHLFLSDGLQSYPFLRALRKPLIRSLVTGVDSRRRPMLGFGARARWLVVLSDEDKRVLEGWEYAGVKVIPPGLDLDGFTPHPPPVGPGFSVLAGSAPWTKRQFRSKGVDLWLRLAKELPELRLIFLWRGTLEDEMIRRVRRLGLADRVEIVTEKTDVNRVLMRAHAATVLTKSSNLVKAFPHSLIEALAAGRPVIVSRVLAMSGFVEKHGCGEVVERLSRADLLAALRRLMKGYSIRRERTLRVPLERFSLRAYVDAYGEIFRSAVNEPDG